MSGTAEPPVMLPGDNPIKSADQDALGRAALADTFAHSVAALNAAEGAVVGVLGPWGSGKTSFINLAREGLRGQGIDVLDFNPWMFSGASQLVEFFFRELSIQLKCHARFQKIGDLLEEYSEALAGLGWLPVAGSWIDRLRVALKAIGALARRRQSSIQDQRARLTEALKNLEKPIAVVLDDIDRLSASEIRDVFKLVRLTASFPNVIYIIAFDRAQVEKALSVEGMSGRTYLEKITQLVIDLPCIPSELLLAQLTLAITTALAGIDNTGPFDDQVWPDVLMEIIWPLVGSMRDVRRYAVAISNTVCSLRGEVALCDVLAMESIRLFLPDAFRVLRLAVEGLTATSDSGRPNPAEETRLKKQVEGLASSCESRESVTRALIERLFPAGARHIGGSNYGADWKVRWLRERRIAHEEILHLYLEGVADQGLRALVNAELAWSRAADAAEFERHLRAIDADDLQETITSFELLQDEFLPETVVPASIVLLNLIPDIPRRQRSMFDLVPGFAVSRVVLRLLRRLDTPKAVELAVREILPNLNTLASKLELVNLVGHHPNAGHQLVTPEAALALAREWREELRSTPVDRLAKEDGLLWMLHQARTDADEGEPPLVIDESPLMTLGILRSSRSETLGQSMGSRAVRRSPRLAWDALVELFGNEASLKTRLQALREASIEDSEELLALADRYASGWRPSE